MGSVNGSTNGSPDISSKDAWLESWVRISIFPGRQIDNPMHLVFCCNDLRVAAQHN